MSELAAAIHDIKTGAEGSTTAMHDALQHHFSFPIELVELAYIPPDDIVRAHVRPRNDTTEVEHQLSRGDSDIELEAIERSLLFEFK